MLRRKPINLPNVLLVFPILGSCPVCRKPLLREYAIRVRGDRGDATGYRQQAHECGEIVDADRP